MGFPRAPCTPHTVHSPTRASARAYEVQAFLQVSSINFWSRTGGSVSERRYDSVEVHYRGIQNERGRLMMLMTHNTNITDTWEREGESREYFGRFSPSGDAIGVDTVIDGMTH